MKITLWISGSFTRNYYKLQIDEEVIDLKDTKTENIFEEIEKILLERSIDPYLTDIQLKHTGKL